MSEFDSLCCSFSMNKIKNFSEKSEGQNLSSEYLMHLQEYSDFDTALARSPTNVWNCGRDEGSCEFSQRHGSAKISRITSVILFVMIWGVKRDCVGLKSIARTTETVNWLTLLSFIISINDNVSNL